MLLHRGCDMHLNGQTNPSACPAPTASTAQSHAAAPQSCGFANFASISTTHCTASLPTIDHSLAALQSSTSTLPQPPTSSVPTTTPLSPRSSTDEAAMEAEELANDLHAVRNKIYQWKQEDIITDDTNFDLVQHWDVSLCFYSLMFCIDFWSYPLSVRIINMCSLSCSKWPSTFYPFRHPPCPANECSRWQKRLALFVKTFCLHH